MRARPIRTSSKARRPDTASAAATPAKIKANARTTLQRGSPKRFIWRSVSSAARRCSTLLATRRAVNKPSTQHDPKEQARRRYVRIVATFGVAVWIAALGVWLDGNGRDALNGFLLGLAIILSAFWIGSFMKRA